MNNSDPTSVIDDICTLCLKEKPIIETYKLSNEEYWAHLDFRTWIRLNLDLPVKSPNVKTCLDCYKAWDCKDTSYLNTYVLKQRLLR